jgi:hypothetical protein
MLAQSGCLIRLTVGFMPLEEKILLNAQRETPKIAKKIIEHCIRIGWIEVVFGLATPCLENWTDWIAKTAIKWEQFRILEKLLSIMKSENLTWVTRGLVELAGEQNNVRIAKIAYAWNRGNVRQALYNTLIDGNLSTFRFFEKLLRDTNTPVYYRKCMDPFVGFIIDNRMTRVIKILKHRRFDFDAARNSAAEIGDINTLKMLRTGNISKLNDALYRAA